MYGPPIRKTKLKIKSKCGSVILRSSPPQTGILKCDKPFSFNEDEMSDIGFGFERLQVTITSKALAISPLVQGSTLGSKKEHDEFTDEFSTVMSSINSLSSPSNMKMNTKINDKELSFEEHQCNELAGRKEKLLFELEQQRTRLVTKSINKRISEMMFLSQNSLELSSDHVEAIDLRTHLDNKKAMRDAEEISAEEMHRSQKELFAQMQRQRYEKDQAMQLAEKIKKEQEEKKMLTVQFKTHEKEFRNKYQTLSDSVRSCHDKQTLHSSSANNFFLIKKLDEGMRQLADQCVVGEMSHLDLKTASAIIRQLETYSTIILEEVKKVNKSFVEQEKIAKQLNAEKAENEKIARELEAETEKLGKEVQAKEAAAAAATARAAAAQHVSSGLTPEVMGVSKPPANEISVAPPASKKSHLGYLEGCVDSESFESYKALKMHLDAFQLSFSQLSQDPKYKDFTFNCKKAVNIPVNAIGDKSGEHLLDKFQRLVTLLKGETVQINNIPFRASVQPHGINFCMDLIANKLVNQGKTSVSSKPESAYPIAAVVVALWAEIPDFGKLILAHFHKACPYLVPIFLPQVEGQSDEEYYRSLGYQYENGNVEKQEFYMKKMSGIMRLYAAVMVSNVRRQQRVPHPHGISEGWRWIACFVNLDPLPTISATLLLIFLEVTGNAMFAAYRQQFQKLLHLICKEYFLKLKKIELPGGHMSRLEAFLHEMLKNSSIPSPQGLLPPNFW